MDGMSRFLFAGQQESKVNRLTDLWAAHAFSFLRSSVRFDNFANEREEIRCWVIRFFSEEEEPGKDRMFQAMVELIATEKSPFVRREAASAASRLMDKYNTLPLLHHLLRHKEDANDPMIPQMLWLAYEKQLNSQLSGGRKPPESASGKTQGADAPRSVAVAELEWLAANAPNNALITDHILPKVMRRLVATQKPEDLSACVDFIGKVNDAMAKQRCLEGLVEGLKGRVVEPPAQWDNLAASLTSSDKNKNVAKLVEQLNVNFKSAAALKRAYEVAHDLKKPAAERTEAVKNVVLLKHPDALALCVSMSRQESDPVVRLEACRSLAAFDRPEVGRDILAFWDKYPPEVKREMLNVLKTRKEWARQLLDALGQKKVDRLDVHNNIIMAITAFKDRQLDQQIEKVWGQVRQSPPPAELEELIAKMRKFVTEKDGDAERGRVVFEKNCLQCHKYEGKGHAVGPELDGAERSLDYILINVLDPNRVIGLPYYRKTVLLKNGKLVNGLLHAEEPNSITIKGENAVLEVIQRSDIDMEKTEPKSLMPEGLDKNMKPEELRDLVRYLLRK
jgi:putative heme-binding domain-containing protein